MQSIHLKLKDCERLTFLDGQSEQNLGCHDLNVQGGVHTKSSRLKGHSFLKGYNESSTGVSVCIPTKIAAT